MTTWKIPKNVLASTMDRFEIEKKIFKFIAKYQMVVFVLRLKTLYFQKYFVKKLYLDLVSLEERMQNFC